MKNLPIGLLLCVFALTSIVAPAAVFADYDDDDDKYEYRDDDDDSDDDWRDGFAVEADVYTDITIVTVEKYSKKTTYRTDADTRAEVIDFVTMKYGVGEDDIDNALDFEVEDRASRSDERAKISFEDNRKVKTCDDDSDDDIFEIEADVFTDTTVVKVEKYGKKTVFETDADTRAEVITVIADKFDLDESDVDDVLDFEIEDRASRTDDSRISSSNSDDDCDDDRPAPKPSKPVSEIRDAEIRAKIEQLQTLIEALMKLLALRLGSSN